MNITDALVPYFEGKVSWDKAASEACELFLKTFESATLNEHGIFIESNRTEVRGARNSVIKENICANCCKIASEV